MSVKKGKPKIRIDYKPSLEYAIGETVNYSKKNFIVSIFEDSSTYETLYLYSNIDKENILNSNEFVLEKDSFFMISYNEKISNPDISSCVLAYEKTKVYWLNWCNKTPKFKLYNSEVLRSAMTLKLLTYEKSGAVLAAATTSIPETIGEVRNWDYRFCWIRDASMVIKVITKLGHKKIVKNFINYIIELVPDKNCLLYTSPSPRDQ